VDDIDGKARLRLWHNADERILPALVQSDKILGKLSYYTQNDEQIS